jgi:hypothetical protein
MLDIASQVVAILAPVMSGGASAAQEIAAKVLTELISQRLFRNEEGRRAWDVFRANPQNDSLVLFLLQRELERDPDFRLKIENQLRGVAKSDPTPIAQQAISASGSTTVQIAGPAKHVITGGTHSTSTVNNKNINERSNVDTATGVAAIVVVVVVALVIFVGVKIVGGLQKSSKDAGLSANSTCQQFLNTDEDDERQALADIAISEGYSGYSNPLATPEVQSECGDTPSMTLGALIKRDGDMH